MAKDKDEIKKEKPYNLFDEEKKKLNFLENLAKYFYTNKVQIDKDNTLVGVSMTPTELKELVKIENELMKMRRRIYGLGK